MPFTSSEKRQVRTYLGYSGGFRDLNYRLESMFEVIGDDVDALAYARELLVAIDAVDDAIASSGTSGSSAEYGAVKKVDEIEFHDIKDGSSGTSTLSGRKYGEVLIERLRTLFGVDLEGYYFRGSFHGSFFFGPGV